MLERSDATPSGRVGTEPQDEELRRLAALVLMVYIAEDGIRRYLNN
jgi:hypothetical protein